LPFQEEVVRIGDVGKLVILVVGVVDGAEGMAVVDGTTMEVVTAITTTDSMVTTRSATV